MSQIDYEDHIKAFIAVIQTVYANTLDDLDAAEERALTESAISERFGFMMISGATLGALDNYLASIKGADDQYDFPHASALALIKDTIEGARALSDESDFLEHLKEQAQEQLGYQHEVALQAGRELGLTYMTERMNDFLEISPLTKIDASPSTEPSFRHDI